MTTRVQMEEFWEDWLAINRDAERVGDWSSLADSYAEGANYGWMFSPNEHFMAVGRQEIREWAVGLEMVGLEGWHYDYQATVMDEKNGMIVGFWKQKSGVVNDESGDEYEIVGLGGSWFGLAPAPAGGLHIAWQRDWFDLGSTAETFLSILKAGKATPGLLARMKLNGPSQPGHYTLAELPSTVWPPPVEDGAFLAQDPIS